MPKPKETKSSHGEAFRYVEKLPQQAIVLKSLRVLTGVQSAWLLLAAGFTQECASIQRVLGELDFDILFLCGPLIFGKKEERHSTFLADFFQEEFDEGKTALDSLQKRHRVPRDKIRAYCARVYSLPEDVSTASRVFKTIDASYSGYIHASGSTAFDYYFGGPPHFHTEGVAGTYRQSETALDLRNTLFRSVHSFATAAKALGDEQLFQHLRHLSNQLNNRLHLHD